MAWPGHGAPLAAAADGGCLLGARSLGGSGPRAAGGGHALAFCASGPWAGAPLCGSGGGTVFATVDAWSRALQAEVASEMRWRAGVFLFLPLQPGSHCPSLAPARLRAAWWLLWPLAGAVGLAPSLCCTCGHPLGWEGHGCCSPSPRHCLWSARPPELPLSLSPQTPGQLLPAPAQTPLELLPLGSRASCWGPRHGTLRLTPDEPSCP